MCKSTLYAESSYLNTFIVKEKAAQLPDQSGGMFFHLVSWLLINIP
jgi:hypothetical protein